MKRYNVEFEWLTEAGFKAVITRNLMLGNLCGYVGLPEGHPLYGIDYREACPALAGLAEGIKNESLGKRSVFSLLIAAKTRDGTIFPSMDVVFDVHGSITYTGGGNGSSYPIESDLWWAGFDCAHCHDAIDLPESVAGFSKHIDDMLEQLMNIDTEPWETPRKIERLKRTFEYVRGQCESLAQQLLSVSETEQEEAHSDCEDRP